MDKLREDTRERTWEDYVEDAAAVLAVGAGAAYFLRSGGGANLSKISNYITGARKAYASGSFEVGNMSKFWTETRRHAGELIKEGRLDLEHTSSFESVFKGWNLKVNPKAQASAIRDLQKGFKMKYGESVLNQMIEHDSNQFVNEDAVKIIKDRLESFASDEGLNEVELHAALAKAFGPDVEDSAYDEAIKMASEVQRQMRKVDVTDVVNHPREDFSAAVYEFGGIDQKGNYIWNTNKIVDTVTLYDPTKKVADMADIHINPENVLRNQEEKSKSMVSKLYDSLFGEEVTVGEFEEYIENKGLEAKDIDAIFAKRRFSKTSTEEEIQSTWQSLQDIQAGYKTQEERDAFKKIKISGLRRDDMGNIYSMTSIKENAKFFGDMAAQTLPGRMLRLTESIYNLDKPETYLFKTGSLDYNLSKALGNMSKELRTTQNILFSNGRFYKDTPTGFEVMHELDEFGLAPNEIGSSREILKALRDVERAKAKGKTGFFDGFDSIGIHSRPLSEEYGSQINSYLGLNSFVDRILGADIAGVKSASREGGLANMRVGKFLSWMDRNSHLQDALNVKDITRLIYELRKDENVNKDAIRALSRAARILRDPTDEEALKYLGQFGTLSNPKEIRSHGLSNLISDFMKDSERTRKQMITVADKARLKGGKGKYVSYGIREQTAQHLVGEAFLRINPVDVPDPYATEVIDSALARAFGKTTTKYKDFKAFAAATIVNQHTRRFLYKESRDTKNALTVQLLRGINNSKLLGESRGTFIFDAFEDMKNRFGFEKELLDYSRAGETLERLNPWGVVHKRYTFAKQLEKAKEMLAPINGKIKMQAIINAAREAAKPITQYFSGPDMFQAMSDQSHRLYHVFARVDDQLNREFNLFGRHYEINLGLSKQDRGSAFDIVKNLTLKRVFPLAAAYTYLDFMDDTTRYITGQGLGEAGLSGLANINLAFRKFTGATGLDYTFKGITSDSPFARYFAGYFGDTNPEWHSYEEEKDYYERGYTPMRKARYWWFGSSNEYRGNKISYFEPNTLRMMHSNYFMESMYEGSMWTKWSHSLLPTPLNPLSPLNYLIDPYYLENLHKEDRPYPITGSTFAENTPWGIALNPIFDTFIKPRKQMYRDRLGSDGVDVKALVAHINDNIRRRANNEANGDIIYLQNGKLRSMLFTAFNAPTPSERIIGQIGPSVAMATEYGEYGAGVSAEDYANVASTNAEQLHEIGIQNYAATTAGVKVDDLSISDRLVISSAKGNVAAGALVDAMKATGVFDALRGANQEIRMKGMLRKDLGMFYENKMQYESSSVDDLLADSETIADLMTAGKGHDYIHEMAVSTRMISGLYGYLANLAFGFGENNAKKIATSYNMESAGRSFWDLSLGGFDPSGGDIMEIARRFIPEYHRMQQVNPLMNNMPDWLPERMRFGDPYASIPKGEARLPGRGYESLNKLHPDIYGRYGAFDRFKILADIAPYSPEYKFWKKVVGATIQDPELKKEIQEIKDRVAEQTGGHDFFEYKYIGRGVTQRNAVVSEILSSGKFKIVGDEQIYKMSGISVQKNDNETTEDVLSRYLIPGQEITLFTDENPAYARNNDRFQTINAGVMIGGENIAEQMLNAGDAKVRKGDTSATSYMLNHGNLVNTLNTIQEFIGHLNVPVLHSRWLKMDSPLESYLDDNVYGTSFQSWSTIWGTFIRPSLQIQANSPGWLASGIAIDIINNNLKNEGNLGVRNVLREFLDKHSLMQNTLNSRKLKTATSVLRPFTDRGALAGLLGGGVTFLGSSGYASKVSKSEKLGSVIGLAFAALDNPNDLAVSTMSWSRLGYMYANEILHKNRKLGAGVGALIGIGRWMANKKLLADEQANIYIPEATKKKWDMQEYFDRLTYIKYMGLFEQAADMAKEKEGVDIRQIVAAQQEERRALNEQKKNLRDDLAALDRQHDNDSEEAKTIIRRHLNKISGAKIALRGGEYTKSAIMYKNAADATMYGLQEDAVMADIVRALPKTERDYFIEFMKEKDEDKRKEILRTVSPLLNRALRTIWKMPVEPMQSNEDYFEHHTLPAPTWAGWRPDIDLANVEAKVIYNQGMAFSDFGIYASQYRDQAVINAPNIDYTQEQRSTLLTRLKLQMALAGTGLDAKSVSVEPSQDSTIQVIANVARIIPYKISEEFNNLF
jgi:hypothetical protein